MGDLFPPIYNINRCVSWIQIPWYLSNVLRFKEAKHTNLQPTANGVQRTVTQYFSLSFHNISDLLLCSKEKSMMELGSSLMQFHWLERKPVFLNALLMQVEDIVFGSKAKYLAVNIYSKQPCPDITAFALIFYTGNILGLNTGKITKEMVMKWA